MLESALLASIKSDGPHVFTAGVTCHRGRSGLLVTIILVVVTATATVIACVP